MKITKGIKLTPKQKAQRKASRLRNQQAWSERLDKDQRDRHAQHEQTMAQLNAQIEAIKNGTIIRISLDLRQYPEIKTALKFYQPAEPPLAHVAEMLLNLALTHPDQLIAWKNALVKYRQTEGLTGVPNADTNILVGWIAGRKEYRTHDENAEA
jgi:hypothetical protein